MSVSVCVCVYQGSYTYHIDNIQKIILHYFTIRIKICSNDHSMLTKMNDY